MYNTRTVKQQDRRFSIAGPSVALGISGLGMKRPSIPAAEFFVRVNPEHSKKGRTQANQKDSEKSALKGNPDTSPALNPPPLLDHPLREDQRPSLAWMLDKEDGKRDLV
jgi:hypothetical protein